MGLEAWRTRALQVCRLLASQLARANTCNTRPCKGQQQNTYLHIYIYSNMYTYIYIYIEREH